MTSLIWGLAFKILSKWRLPVSNFSLLLHWDRIPLQTLKMPFFLAGFLKKNDSGGWFNIFKTGSHWSKKQKARINRQRGSEEDRGKKRASTGEGGETVLNNAVNYSESRARERRWNNTEQCRERKLTRAIERRRKYPTDWLRRLQNFPSVFKNSRDVMLCSPARKVTWFGQVMRKRNQTFLSVREVTEQ